MGQRKYCARQGDARQEGNDAMPMHRTIGMSLACLLTSVCAIAKTPEKSTSHYPGEATSVPRGNAGMPTGRSRDFHCGAAQKRRSIDYTSERVEQRLASGQFGKAAWYDLVGNQTASGEVLDTITATAAHRSLPLNSYAKVTSLDNGHSITVKINDRGPYTRGRIIDLSPRAADALDMKRTGVASVVIEPLVNQAAPTIAAFQTSGTEVAQ
jgi:rare lipoprotein A